MFLEKGGGTRTLFIQKSPSLPLNMVVAQQWWHLAQRDLLCSYNRLSITPTKGGLWFFFYTQLRM